MKERHDIDELEKEIENKNFFNSQVVNIFKFVVAIILIVATVVTMYVICKHNKLRALVTSLALQQVKEVKAEGTEDVKYKHECTAQFYIILTLKHCNDRFNYICNSKALENKIILKCS